MLISGDEELNILLKANPHLQHVVKYYDYKLSELKFTADRIAELTRALNQEYSGDRGAVARTITKHPLYFIGFLALDRCGSGSELLLSQPMEKLLKLIDDYHSDDLRRIFEIPEE